MNEKAQVLAKAVLRFLDALSAHSPEDETPGMAADIKEMAREILKHPTPIQLGDTVYHREVGQGKIPCRVVGSTFGKLELEYNAPTYVCKWYFLDGILTEKQQ